MTQTRINKKECTHHNKQKPVIHPTLFCNTQRFLQSARTSTTTIPTQINTLFSQEHIIWKLLQYNFFDSILTFDITFGDQVSCIGFGGLDGYFSCCGESYLACGIGSLFYCVEDVLKVTLAADVAAAVIVVEACVGEWFCFDFACHHSSTEGIGISATITVWRRFSQHTAASAVVSATATLHHAWLKCCGGHRWCWSGVRSMKSPLGWCCEWRPCCGTKCHCDGQKWER